MPLSGHRHSSSFSGQYDEKGNPTLDNTSEYPASHTLISIGTPAGDVRISISRAREDNNNSSSTGGNQYGGGQAGSLASNGPKPKPSTMPASPNPNMQNYETPRRTQTFGRPPEELHLPPNYNAMGQVQSRDQSHHNSYYDDSASGGGAQGGLQTSASTTSIPGALQPGNAGRPGPLSSSHTAPSTVPTLPQISTQSQPYSTPTRATTMSHSHSHSRSSPTGLDQKYTPYTQTPEDSKFASPPAHRYTSSQTPQGASYSPLGLADIRPRADSGLSDGPQSANPYATEFSSQPTNCNYLAPWAVYAFDWCKWPVQHHGLGDSAGKMAIGSYLEDGHNFVSIQEAFRPTFTEVLTRSPDPNTGDPDSA